MKEPMHNPIVKLIVSITLIVGLGSLGGLFTAPEIPYWYASLQKPSFNPPNWIFAPVWTLLYTLMAIGFYLVWKQVPSRARNLAIGWFVIQFVLNLGWSFLFFNQHQLGWALVEIVAMWVGIVFTIVYFRRVSPVAAWLLVPYLLWVSFATVLNAAIWKLNS